MPDRTRRTPGIDHQTRLVAGAIRPLLGHPAPVVYPALKAISAVLAVVAVGVIALSPIAGIGPDVPMGAASLLVVVPSVLFVLYVVGPIVALLLDVAYCYELNELLDGRRPTPGSGLVVALGRLPAVSLGAVVASGTFFAGYVTEMESLRVGSGVLGIVLPAALAAEDRSVSALVDRIDGAVVDQWGSAALTVYGARTLERLAGTLGIAGAVAVVVGHVAGVLPFVSTLPQALFLAVAVFLGGFALTTFLRALVSGPVSTALYRYATTDRVGERCPLDVAEILDAD